MNHRRSTQLGRWFLALLSPAIFIGCTVEDSPVTPIRGNHQPTISTQADTAAVIGDTLRLLFTAADLDGDPLSFEQEVMVTWQDAMAGYHPVAGIGSQDGSFWWFVQPEDEPGRSVIVTVRDGRRGEASVVFDVVVSEGR